jgi:hypothetical protein
MKCTTNAMKHTTNTPECIKKTFKYFGIFSNTSIYLKNSFFYFNIHTYNFQIHYSTFQKPYIILTYITIPLLYSNILPYTSIYVEIVMKPIYSALLCLVTKLFFETILVPHNSTKMSCIYHNIFSRIQK